MISEDQKHSISRYGRVYLDLIEGDYNDVNDRATYDDMLRLGVVPKEQLVDGRYYLGFYFVPGHYEVVQALWVSAVDAFVFRENAGPNGLVEAFHYFYPYPEIEYLFIPFFDTTTVINEPQGEPDEQLRRPPAEHTA